MTEEMYKKLNDHLNDCLVYFNKTSPIFVNNLKTIFTINNELYSISREQSIEYKKKEVPLTFEEVFLLAREVIGNIDKSYLESFDNLIKTGELHFEYEEVYDSFCRYNSSKNIKTIDISRLFNYDDVVTLVHEYMHYTSSEQETTYMRNFLTEFISIYFEEYARNYLIETKKIDDLKSSINRRIISTFMCNNSLYSYITILMAYESLGNINSNTKEELQTILKITNNIFEEECVDLLNNIENNFEKISYRINVDYKYVFGTLLAFYALENVEFDKMVKLNNNINSYEYSLMSLEEVLSTIGVEMNSETLEKSLDCFESKIYKEGKTK